jgi:transposase
MKAYSLDLRQKIIETYESGGITQRELAEQFHVSLNFIVTLLRRWRRDETIEPKKRGAVMKPLLTPEIMQFLSEQIERECDLSLSQLVELVREKYSVSVSAKTISRMLRRENLRYKKNAFTPASEIPRELKI